MTYAYASFTAHYIAIFLADIALIIPFIIPFRLFLVKRWWLIWWWHFFIRTATILLLLFSSLFHSISATNLLLHDCRTSFRFAFIFQFTIVDSLCTTMSANPAQLLLFLLDDFWVFWAFSTLITLPSLNFLLLLLSASLNMDESSVLKGFHAEKHCVQGLKISHYALKVEVVWPEIVDFLIRPNFGWESWFHSDDIVWWIIIDIDFAFIQQIVVIIGFSMLDIVWFVNSCMKFQHLLSKLLDWVTFLDTRTSKISYVLKLPLPFVGDSKFSVLGFQVEQNSFYTFKGRFFTLSSLLLLLLSLLVVSKVLKLLTSHFLR